ncbi:MAG: DUF45 domain-containing protein [Clostridia bacterium]|nr:DUF45 domain-containing protein [Clostridia bacterium]
MKIIKQNRKSICLQVKNNGEVILKVPINLPQKNIDEFLVSKQNWLDKSLKRINQTLEIKSKYDFNKYVYLFDDNFNKDEILKKYKNVKNFYKANINYLLERVEFFKNKYNFNLTKVTINNSVRNWGTFNSKFEMKLNLKCLILKKDLIDYIIIHEFCHSKQLNHSKLFWQEVMRIIPNYKILKKEVRDFGFLLRENLY